MKPYKAALLVFAACAVLCNGCKKQQNTQDTDSDRVSYSGKTENKPDAEFDPLPGDGFSTLVGRDLPLGERPVDMDRYFDPGQAVENGVLSSTSVAGSDENVEFSGLFADIHFDFDSFSLGREARDRLVGIGAYLRGQPSLGLVIEGHCDERGSASYNMALGEKRALAVREFLASMDVDPDRLHTVSFGEEVPLVRESNERAWRMNRRVHFRPGREKGGAGP